ncbi:MAG: ice-binding family protein [Bacteroidota bacterium]
MKTKLLNTLTASILLLIPAITFAQAPALGTTANYALFTGDGEVKNVGITYLTHITGNVGTNNGPVNGFGNVNGVMTHTSDALSMQAKADLLVAHGLLQNTTPTDNTLAVMIGSGPGQVLTANVYSITGAVITLDQNLILDAQGDANSVFIFKLQGAFSTNTNAKVKLINGALACNVFWKVDGLVDMAAGTSMKGTIISAVAINMGVNDTLEGRALSLAGAITVGEDLVYKPVGCGSPTLTGPSAPTLASAACYALFTSSGQVTNTGSTHVTGDIGTNGATDSVSGYNALLVTGSIHHYSDGSTATCAVDLGNAYTYLSTLPNDIELLYPAQFGHNLELTPHTYLMNSATELTDTVFLNAQGNANAVFVIQITGAFSTSTHSQIVLTNGAQAKNVFWKIYGATSINDSSDFKGTIVCYGAVDLAPGVTLAGRALIITGDLTTDSATVTIPTGCGVTTGINETEKNSLNIYPNPFTNQVNIKIDESQINKYEFRLYNMLGDEVMNLSVSQQVTTLETSKLPAGIYFYQVNANNKIIQSGKLISQQ